MKNLFVIVSVCAFLVGVAWRSVTEVAPALPIWFLFLALVVGLIWRRKSFAFSAPFLLGVSLSLLFVSLGIIRTETYSWQFDVSPLEESLNQTVSLTGIITQEPDYRANSVYLYVQVNQDLVLVTADRLGQYHYGEEVTVKGKLERPKAFTTDLGRTFNYSGYLLAKGVEYKISFAQISVVKIDSGNLFLSKLLEAKNIFIASIESVIPEPQAGLGEGLLLGVKSALGSEIEQNFRRTGLIHIVVLSGYNVMLVVAFIMYIFSFFLPFRLRIGAGILAIIIFALMVGLSATVVRASVMAGLVLLAQVIGRRYDVLRALILAGWVMIIINPYLLVYDVGFQLSFMATLGLILIVPHFEATVVNEKSRLGWREFFLATISTQIAVLPILMYHIGEVSLIAVLTNLLVLPVVPLAMLLTFITGVLGLVFVPLASLIGFLANLSLAYILFIADFFGTMSFAAISVPQFSALGVVVMYGLMAGVLIYLKFRNHSSEATKTLSGWTIEEELDELVIKKVDSKSEPTSVVKLPIFFR